jgi:uncharacterized protein YqeY
VPASTGLRAALRNALGGAMKDRDQIAVAAFRSALGVVDNAEAADLSQAPAIEPGTIAGGVVGLGAGEVPRRELSDEQLAARLRAEVADWKSTAADYERHGRTDSAMRLYAEAAILSDLLDLLDVPGPA